MLTIGNNPNAGKGISVGGKRLIIGAKAATVPSIDLRASALDSRVTYTGPAHSYRNSAGGLSQSVANAWPLEYIAGVAVGRHLPEAATTSLITDPRFTALTGGNNAWMISGGGTAQLATGTAIDGGNALRVSTTYSKPAIYNGSAFIVPDTTAWVTQNLDNSWVRKYVSGTFAAAASAARFYPARQDASNYVYFLCAASAGSVIMSEIRKPRGDQTDDLCLVQAEYNSFPTSPILSGNTRAASSVTIARVNNVKGITVNFSDGSNTALGFSGSTLNLPLSSSVWGVKYITTIDYRV